MIYSKKANSRLKNKSLHFYEDTAYIYVYNI